MSTASGALSYSFPVGAMGRSIGSLYEVPLNDEEDNFPPLREDESFRNTLPNGMLNGRNVAAGAAFKSAAVTRTLIPQNNCYAEYDPTSELERAEAAQIVD